MIINTLNRLKVSFFFSALIVCQGACGGTLVGKTSFPTKSFVQVLKHVNIKKCKDKTPCSVGDFVSTGSGGVVGHVQGSVIILTARHVCLSTFTENVKKMILEHDVTIKVRFWDDKYYLAEVINISADPKLDLCAISVSRERMPKIELSHREPRVGDKIYAMSAPAGVWHPPAVPILSGIYSGKIQDSPNSLITIPAMGGSSGSLVLNEQKQVIGVIFAAVVGFHHVAQATNFAETRAFIESSLQKAWLRGEILQSIESDLVE